MTDDLVSVRGLVDSDFDNPLREFTGTFDGYDTAPASGYSGTRVDLKFLDIEDVVTAPGFVYNLPTAVINLGLSNKNKSKWGYLGNSLAEFLLSDEDIKDCKGRRMRLRFCDGQDNRPAPKPIWNKDADPTEYPDKMVPTPVWVVTELEGAAAPAAGESSGASAADHAEENLIGKTRAQFNKWAFADPKIRKDTALQRSITDKSFINSLIQLGRIAEDSDGVFQKVEAE
jgi:hypothetical protein